MNGKKYPYGSPGSHDRLADYAGGEITADLAKYVCDIKKPNDCPADECDGCPGFEAMSRLEYDMQTEIIAFAKDLIAKWAEASIKL